MSEEPKLEELDRLITRGKQKGFLTYDEVNDALPSDIVSLDQLDDIMMMFGAMDIEVVDSAKAGRLPSEVGRERQPAPAEEADDDGPADAIGLSPRPRNSGSRPVAGRRRRRARSPRGGASRSRPTGTRRRCSTTSASSTSATR